VLCPQSFRVLVTSGDEFTRCTHTAGEMTDLSRYYSKHNESSSDSHRGPGHWPERAVCRVLCCLSYWAREFGSLCYLHPRTCRNHITTCIQPRLDIVIGFLVRRGSHGTQAAPANKYFFPLALNTSTESVHGNCVSRQLHVVRRAVYLTPRVRVHKNQIFLHVVSFAVLRRLHFKHLEEMVLNTYYYKCRKYMYIMQLLNLFLATTRDYS
jgi:hypothetical protein